MVFNTLVGQVMFPGDVTANLAFGLKTENTASADDSFDSDVNNPFAFAVGVSKRFKAMKKPTLYAQFGDDSTLILNANHPLVQYVVDHKDGENTELFCKQLYDLAMIAHKPLNPEEMTEFVKRSNEIMLMLTK